MKNTKKAICIALILCILVTALAGCGAKKEETAAPEAAAPEAAAPEAAAPEGKPQYYSFISSASGALWYNMTGGAITLFNEKIPNVNFSIEASGGSTENCERVTNGEADFGFTYANHLFEMYNGTGNFANSGGKKTAKVLCQAYDSPHFFITLKGSGINTIEDLAGKRVSLGPPGSGSLANSIDVLTALELIDDIDSCQMGFADAGRALQDGQIDAIGQSGYNSANVVELAATCDINIIPYTDEQLDIIERISPYFHRGIMPAGSYEGQDVDVPTFFFNVFIIANESVPADIVEQCLEIIFTPENKAYLTTVHPSWADICNNPEGVEAVGAEYHPGAVEYWKNNA